MGDLLDLPDDDRTEAEAERLGLDEPVLIRDVVRLVEVKNLADRGFFNRKSVLAGSMALRCYGSPRFTVYDADFSTSSETVDPPDEMVDRLTYRGDRLSIEVENFRPHDLGETNWEAVPVNFDARFTRLITPDDSTFKADVSFRGLIEDGRQEQIAVPYELGLWPDGDAPVVFVMDPHEIVAEKVLGWCVGRRVKHYADLGYIAEVAHWDAANGKPLIELTDTNLREVLAAKLEVMRRIQPERHSRYQHIDGLIGELAKPPRLPQSQWNSLQYVRPAAAEWTMERITRSVRELLLPRLRSRVR
jgi:Nucleotidyl transferase AbiEii toxin, Type IV TA system